MQIARRAQTPGMKLAIRRSKFKVSLKYHRRKVKEMVLTSCLFRPRSLQALKKAALMTKMRSLVIRDRSCLKNKKLAHIDAEQHDPLVK